MATSGEGVEGGTTGGSQCEEDDSSGNEEAPLGDLLRHGRDVHPAWVSVDNMTTTLRVWDSRVLSPMRT